MPDQFDRYCGLTMRGGTTSGVVYPLAACALSEHYEFRSLGGSSAGAIAADIRLTLDELSDLVKGPFDGAPPIDPDLRLTPPE